MVLGMQVSEAAAERVPHHTIANPLLSITDQRSERESTGLASPRQYHLRHKITLRNPNLRYPAYDFNVSYNAWHAFGASQDELRAAAKHKLLHLPGYHYGMEYYDITFKIHPFDHKIFRDFKKTTAFQDIDEQELEEHCQYKLINLPEYYYEEEFHTILDRLHPFETKMFRDHWATTRVKQKDDKFMPINEREQQALDRTRRLHVPGVLYGKGFDKFCYSIDPLAIPRLINMGLGTVRCPYKSKRREVRKAAKQALVAALDLTCAFNYKPGQQTAYFSKEKEDVPIIVDTGASVCITPCREDFVRPITPLDFPVQGLTSNGTCIGVGTVRWVLKLRIRKRNGGHCPGLPYSEHWSEAVLARGLVLDIQYSSSPQNR